MNSEELNKLLDGIARLQEVAEAHKARYADNPDLGEMIFDTAQLCVGIGALKGLAVADAPEDLKALFREKSKEMIQVVCALTLKAIGVKSQAEGDRYMDEILTLVKHMTVTA
jgi:hypothetical protein